MPGQARSDKTLMPRHPFGCFSHHEAHEEHEEDKSFAFIRSTRSRLLRRLAPRNDDYPHAYGALAYSPAIDDKTADLRTD